MATRDKHRPPTQLSSSQFYTLLAYSSTTRRHVVYLVVAVGVHDRPPFLPYISMVPARGRSGPEEFPGGWTRDLDQLGVGSVGRDQGDGGMGRLWQQLARQGDDDWVLGNQDPSERQPRGIQMRELFAQENSNALSLSRCILSMCMPVAPI